MKKETYEFILALLYFNEDQLQANKLYLRHQLSLRPQHRVMELTEPDAESQLESINLQLSQYAGTIRDFIKTKPTIREDGVDA